MYVALLVRWRTYFFKRKPAVGRRAAVVRGWLLTVAPLVAGLGASIEDHAVELAYGGGLMSEHA